MILRYLLLSDGGGVYVHCKAGRTRSATIVAAYLILHQNHTCKLDFTQQNYYKNIVYSRQCLRINETKATTCNSSRCSQRSSSKSIQQPITQFTTKHYALHLIIIIEPKALVITDKSNTLCVRIVPIDILCILIFFYKYS